MSYHDDEPGCEIWGTCEAPEEAATWHSASCIHCGKELVRGKDGYWYTWDADQHSDPRPQIGPSLKKTRRHT